MTHPRLHAAAAGAIVLALACGLIHARPGSAPPEPASGRAAGRLGAGPSPAVSPPEKKALPAPARPAARPAATTAPATPPAELPASLAGTEIDGGFDVGPDGHLLPGPRAIALFDYFLSASGEESDAAIRARIEAHARARLAEPALGEALDLLDGYMAYREEGSTLRIREDATAAERLAAIHELRHEIFGAEADPLFGADERAAEVAIAKSEILQDPSLSPGDREGLLAAIDARLPEPARAARAKATSVLDLRAGEAALRADGAGEDVLRRYRESRLGPEAAERLGALDRERAAFQERVDAFRHERDERCGDLADPSPCEADLLERRFDPRERLRVPVLLSMPAP